MRVRNLLVEDIGRWLLREALEIKTQRTADLIRSIKQEDDDVPELESSSEGEQEDDSENYSVEFLRYYKLYYRNNIL